MATTPIFTFGDSSSFDIEKKLPESGGRISATDTVAVSTWTLDSEETSSNVDFIKDAGNIGHDIDDTSSTSTASFVVPGQSKVLLYDECSHDSFHSFTVETSSRLTDDSYDSDFEEACTFIDPDDLLDYLSPGKATGIIPSTLKYPPSLDSASSTHICESRHQTPFTGLPLNPITTTTTSGLLHSPSDSALLNNSLFKDLREALLDECKKHFLPKTLIDMCTPDSTMDVHARESEIERNFGHLDDSYLQKTNQMSGYFPCEFQLNVSEPVKVLHESDSSCSYRDSDNSHLDPDLPKMMNRVEKSGNLLKEAAKGSNSNRYAPYIPRQRTMLSRRAVNMMEEWYAMNYEHPYPNSLLVETIAKAGSITNEQVTKWFANKRNRCKNTRRLPGTERHFSGKCK